MRNKKNTNDSDLKIAGIEALNKALGASSAYKFLTLLTREPTDYVEISRKLYENQSIDEIAKGVRGKFYCPPEKMEIPIYLDKKLRKFYEQVALKNHVDLGTIVNTVLKKEMELQKEIGVK